MSVLELSAVSMMSSKCYVKYVNLDEKWVRLASNGTNLELFKNADQNAQTIDLKKVPDLYQSDPVKTQIWHLLYLLNSFNS